MSARWTSNMPFHNNQQQPNQSSPPYPQENYYSTYNALHQPGGQTLGSVGAPPSQWTSPKGATRGGLNDQAYGTNGDRAIDTSRPAVWTSDSQAQHQTPRGTLTIGRNPQEELHIPQGSTVMSDVHHYGAPPAYGGDQFAVNLQQATPQHGPHSSNPLPGSLQPGLSNRPGALQANSSPSAIPTLPQISTQMQQQTPGISRSMTQSHSHNYSRSSPGNMDQPRYKPFTNTPETSRYPTSSSNMPQTPSAASPYSPLNLASLRTQAEGDFTDNTLSPLPSDSQNPYYQMSSSYIAPWPIYAVDWCKWPPRTNDNGAGKVAIGSYLEDNHNYIQILDAHTNTTMQGDTNFEFTKTAEATHSYPVTRILWEPPSSNKQTTDLLATSGDHLRLWSLPHDQQAYASNTITRKSSDAPLQKLSPLALLSNSKSPEHTAPITSLDWNVVSPSLIITSSIDTTCTIWDIPTLTAKTQLIAHDKEVFDVRFCAASVDVFVSCGADGSVRMFDLRSLEHSTIIYEPSDKSQDKNAQLSPQSAGQSPTHGSGSNSTLVAAPPLLRIAASPHDAHLLATFSQDSNLIRVLDVRQPGQALLELKGHGANINTIEWSSTNRGVLASGADDCCVLLWDLLGAQTPAPSGTGTERGPSAVWECGFEISNLSWAPTAGGLGVCGGKGFWGVQM